MDPFWGLASSTGTSASLSIPRIAVCCLAQHSRQASVVLQWKTVGLTEFPSPEAFVITRESKWSVKRVWLSDPPFGGRNIG